LADIRAISREMLRGISKGGSGLFNSSEGMDDLEKLFPDPWADAASGSIQELS